MLRIVRMNQSEKNRNPSKWRSNDNPRKYSVSCKLAKIIPTTGRKTGVAMTRKFYGEPRKATLHYPPAPEFAGRRSQSNRAVLLSTVFSVKQPNCGTASKMVQMQLGPNGRSGKRGTNLLCGIPMVSARSKVSRKIPFESTENQARSGHMRPNADFGRLFDAITVAK